MSFAKQLWEAKLMPRVNWRLARFGYKLVPVDLNTLIHERLWKRNASEFYFIQVGAFDGSTFDPIARYIRNYRLRGALIEPQKDVFSTLAATYKDYPELVLINAAVTDAGAQATFYRVHDDCGRLPSWTKQLSSFSRENILKHEQGMPDYGIEAVPEIGKYIVAETVPCITFDSVLETLKTNHVDLLQVDAEGYDFELLKAFPFGRLRPAIVRYEHMHLSASDRDDSRALLEREGYRLIPELADTVAYIPKECGF